MQDGATIVVAIFRTIVTSREEQTECLEEKCDLNESGH